MSYNEKCEECKTTGHEYLVGGLYCMRCADEKIDKLEAENGRLKEHIKLHAAALCKIGGE